jgi:hypothetical protein
VARVTLVVGDTNPVADADPSWRDDIAVDAERQRLGVALPAVARERAERVDVGDTGVRILGGDDAAADVSADADLSLAELHAAADPPVLLVRADAVDLEEHPEAAAVERFGFATELGKPLERGL